jgi:hypothetical protein
MWDVVLVLNGAAGAGLKTPKKPARHYGGKPRFGDLLRETRDRSKKTTTVVLR